MPKLPALTSKQIIKLLEQHGFVLDHVTGSHYIFYHPETHNRVVVPYHVKDLPTGTLRAILHQANISLRDL